jgi:UDP-N-acetyl-alpha-D-muramoyl-L-alanyl-L-glutamate epimerase
VSVLKLLDIRRAPDHVAVTCGLDDLRFHFVVWYEDIDLSALARTHGDDLLDRIAFHIAMFQINSVCSLRPHAIDLGPYARFATTRFMELWRTVFNRVWAQWRWQHDWRDYHGPEFIQPAAAPVRPAHSAPGPVDLLAFCGGGKDSLVALKLLERAGLNFATLAYAHSAYGNAARQHALLDRVGAASARARAERQWVIDDFLDTPVPSLRPTLGVSTVLAAETPASVFAALPIALARGYRGLVVAHEASANTSNLNWAGEEVNHQWGKSWEAEVLLDGYLRSELLADVRYFSVLQPIHDEVIFQLLTRDAQLAPLTHSCNVRKPWCNRCAKCAYVWLQMAAHLPASVVRATFGEDLGECPQNAQWFRELVGLTEHTPFECVGSAREARLALALLPRPLGPLMARIAEEAGQLDVAALARPLLGVGEQHGMPAHVAAGLMPQLINAAAAARGRLTARGLGD